MPLINCEVNLILNLYIECVISCNVLAAQVTSFSLTDAKLHDPFVLLSMQSFLNNKNQVLKKQLKYISMKKLILTQNPYFCFFTDPSIGGISRQFMLLFESKNERRTSHKMYFLPTAEINGCNIMIDGRIFFDQPITSDIKTYENTRKNAIGQGDDYINGCLIDYPCFKKII